MERKLLRKKTTPWQRHRVDRFVMSRDFVEELRRRRSLDNSIHAPVDIWSKKHRYQKNYKSYLDDALGLEQPMVSGEDLVAPWPCVPRRKAYLSSAESILDLPTYRRAAFPELIDWSCNNLLVAALGRSYHMFEWKSQGVIGEGLTMHHIQCCKFDPRGELLLIGTDVKTVELHCKKWTLWTSAGHCRCYGYNCSITAVDWSPTGNSFVIGCSRGVVSSFDRTAYPISTWYRYHEQVPVLSVRVSPNTRYVAIVKVKSRQVQVLAWPSLKFVSELISNTVIKEDGQQCPSAYFTTILQSPTRVLSVQHYGNSLHSHHLHYSITWHPWRPALLAWGGASNFKTVGVWDIPSSRVKEMPMGDSNCILDTMIFSRRTGELVLSLWNPDVTSIYGRTSQLVVMSDPYTVVDQSGEGRTGLERVRTMVFNPDGSKLATATAEEDLIIWNFLPEDRKKEKLAKSRRFSAVPVFIDLVTQGFVLR